MTAASRPAGPTPGATRLLPCGERSVLLEFDDLDSVLDHYTALTADLPAHVVDIVPAARTILLVGRGPGDLPALRRLAGPLPRPTDRVAGGAGVVLPVVYDGPDLADVGAVLGCSPEAVVARHTAEAWTVAFCGFAPGFGYLTGAGSWDLPRRAEPRTAVPAGSVGLAGEFSGVYPRSSPGGWQLIGRTDAILFDLERDPPALLSPGTPVRFRAVDR